MELHNSISPNGIILFPFNLMTIFLFMCRYLSTFTLVFFLSTCKKREAPLHYKFWGTVDCFCFFFVLSSFMFIFHRHATHTVKYTFRQRLHAVFQKGHIYGMVWNVCVHKTGAKGQEREISYCTTSSWILFMYQLSAYYNILSMDVSYLCTKQIHARVGIWSYTKYMFIDMSPPTPYPQPNNIIQNRTEKEESRITSIHVYMTDEVSERVPYELECRCCVTYVGTIYVSE